MSVSHRRWILAVSFAVVAIAPAWGAENYDFLAAPQIDLNRVFRVDKTTGEVGACQFSLKADSPIGGTHCYPPGQGAGPQGSSDYALVASRHEHEAGIWRVDQRTGLMSSCYVLDESVVCTPPAK